MNNDDCHVVTGAFGYSGKYIAKRLLDNGHEVKTITNSLNRHNPFGDRVSAHLFNFDQPDKLVETLHGATVLYNTYWVRFNHKTFTHADAVNNTLIMFEAAKNAGVERIVHVSITNPTKDSDLEYFSGKARLEKALMESGLSYAILRPTVLFGKEDILINNIAWMLRKFPVFGVFGDGQYKLQPIYVDDLARLAVKQGEQRENVVIDAIGPEAFTYEELVRTVGEAIGKQRPILRIPPWLGYLMGLLVGKFVGDMTVTREEIDGLMRGLLHVESSPAGEIKLTEWAREHAEHLGKVYASELRRREDRTVNYVK